MRPVMFGKLYACGCFLPKFQMSINTSSKQKVLVLCHSYLRNCVPMHKAFLIHLSTGQSSQVGLLVLKNLQTQAQVNSYWMYHVCLLENTNLPLLGWRWKHRPDHVFLCDCCLRYSFTIGGLDVNSCDICLAIVSIAFNGGLCHLEVARSHSHANRGTTVITQSGVIYLQDVLRLLACEQRSACTGVQAITLTSVKYNTRSDL